jgi:Immunity protein 8
MLVDLKVEGIRSSDVEDLKKWKPKDSNRFHIGIELHTGPADTSPDYHPGQMHYYQKEIATPLGLEDYASALKKSKRPKSIVIAERFLIVSRYDWPEIEAEIMKRVELGRGVTLDICRYQLSRYFIWEFENFKREGQHTS